MFSSLPENIESLIIFDAIILLKNQRWKDIHDELLLKLVTPQNEFGCLFLTRTNIAEFVDIDYHYVERLPPLI